MRYFVTEPTPNGLAVVLECAGDPDDVASYSAPDALAQEVSEMMTNRRVYTEGQLSMFDLGRAALTAWRAGDDSAYEGSVRASAEGFYTEALLAMVADGDVQAVGLLTAPLEQRGIYVDKVSEQKVREFGFSSR